MAKRDGAMAIMRCLFHLTSLVGSWGVPARLAAAFPDIAAWLQTGIGLVNAAKGIDDLPLVIDATSPDGPEDLVGGSVEGPW